MTPVGYKRNTIGVTAAIICAVLLTDVISNSCVSGCKSWERCLTVPECRKMQRENNMRVTADSASSLLFPCDETANVMTICCAIRPPGGQIFEEHPGYNITYEDPQPSYAYPVYAPPVDSGKENGGARPPAQAEKLQLPNDQMPQQEQSNECGLFRAGGSEGDAVEGQFPWLALLGKIDQETGAFEEDCGGTLISNCYVLTSGYCLDNLKAPPKIVRLGVYDRSAGESEPGIQMNYNIASIILHEKLNYPLLMNDIALVQLESKVLQYTDFIRPICLPSAPSPQNTSDYLVAGWRTHGSRGVEASSIPKFGPLSLKNSNLCDLPIPVRLSPETQMCFGGNPSSCFGDYGGPLMEIIKIGDKVKAVQVAIFSYGGSQCNSKFAGELYTRTFPFVDWILKNTSS